MHEKLEISFQQTILYSNNVLNWQRMVLQHGHLNAEIANQLKGLDTKIYKAIFHKWLCPQTTMVMKLGHLKKKVNVQLYIISYFLICDTNVRRVQ